MVDNRVPQTEIFNVRTTISGTKKDPILAGVRRKPKRVEKVVKLKAIDLELALVSYYNPREYLIVPNVSWGLMNYEVDMLILSKTGYATEIEIKVSKYDCWADTKKKHGHQNKIVKHLYFALPDYLLEKCIQYIPPHAGIFTIGWKRKDCKIVRSPETQNKYKFTIEQRAKLGRLGALRIWKLKRKLYGREEI
jgi:hypothetical protein